MGVGWMGEEGARRTTNRHETAMADAFALMAPLKMQYRCMNIIWHPHDYHLTDTRVFKAISGDATLAVVGGSSLPGFYRRMHVFPLPEQATNAHRHAQRTFLRVQRRLHLRWKAMIISRCTQKNWLAQWRGSLHVIVCCATFSGVLRLFQTSLAEKAPCPFDARLPELGLKSLLPC